MSQEDYERCLHDLEDALLSGGIKLRVVVPEESAVPQAPAPEARSQGVPLWMVGAIGATTFLLGLFLGRLSG
jgi:hypothetical protein